MESSSLKCPGCGAPITEIPKTNYIKCAFCESVFKIGNSNSDSVSFLQSKEDFVIKSNILTEYNGTGSEIIIPLGVEKIADNTFRGSLISSVSFPPSLKEIGAYAFADCNNLCCVVIPENVRYIGNRAFWRCSNLSFIEFLNENIQLGDGVILGTKAYKDFLQSYDKELKAEIEEETAKKRKSYGLCPHCGGTYNLFGKCKKCGRKKHS